MKCFMKEHNFMPLAGSLEKGIERRDQTERKI
jgi:hypothetical protein